MVGKKKSRKRHSELASSSASADNSDVSLGNSDVLEVEKIMAKKFCDGKPLYLLRWKGYDSSEDTWEPPENLGCPELLDEFELTLKRAGAGDITQDANESVVECDQASNAKKGPVKTPNKQPKKPRKHKYQELQHDSVSLNDDDPFPTQVPVSSKQSNDSVLEGTASCVSVVTIDKNSTSQDKSGSDASKNASSEVVKSEPKIFLDSDESALERDIASGVAEASSSVATVPATGNGLRGFQRGCEPEKILGATEAGGSLKFLMKWKNCSKVDLVTAEEAGEKCPKLVIDFYVKHLTWSSRPEVHS